MKIFFFPNFFGFRDPEMFITSTPGATTKFMSTESDVETLRIKKYVNTFGRLNFKTNIDHLTPKNITSKTFLGLEIVTTLN
jgi:hypothetical protein